jgi:hypothetical protein
LQSAGGKRRAWPLTTLLLFDFGDDERKFLQLRDDLLRILLVGQVRVVPINLLQLRIEFLSVLGTRRLDGPVLLRLEGANLPLPLDDQAEGDGLHSPGGESGLDAVPEDGAGLVAHQTIENPACLLRLHLVVVNDARFGDGLLDRIFGDLVEQDPVERCLGIQLVGHVPRDRLTLAIGVRCQVHRHAPPWLRASAR